MTPYETIYQYVIDDTKRPDLQAVIDRRIQRALLKYHRKDMWKRDLIEQEYVFQQPNSAVPNTPVLGSNSLFMNSMINPSNTLNIQQIDVTLLTRLRFVQYIRKWQNTTNWGSQITDPATGVPGTLASGDLTERSPDRMFDGYGGDVNDVFYRSGEVINIRSSTPLDKVFIGYFSDPLLEPVTSISSWIAMEYPSLIAAEVKQRIFQDIGKNEEANGAKLELADELLSIYANNITLTMH